MLKKIYFGIQIEENGKYCAIVVQATDSDNLYSKLKIKNAVSANLYPTKKQAEEIVRMWNDDFMQNGTYMYA